MGNQDRKLLSALLALHFPSFLHRCMLMLNSGRPFLQNWHIDAIAYVLKGVLDGRIRRLIINMPPRSLKSTIVSVAFPAFALGQDPSQRIITVSYGTELATNLARDSRAILTSPWYRAAFPHTKITKATESEVHTRARGFRKSTSVGAPLTGFGGNIFIIDDPQKPADAQSDALRNSTNQWFQNTLMSRLDNKQTGVIIIVQQRLHLDDLTGFVTRDPFDWHVLSLPAIAEEKHFILVADYTRHCRMPGDVLHPEHESLETLESLRRQMGPEIFSAQYQQKPVPAGGQMIKRKWLRYYDALPSRDFPARVIQSWDVAAKDGLQNDWSVCTTWLVLDEHYYLLDVMRDRFEEFSRLCETAHALVDRHHPDTVLVEDSSLGPALAQHLERHAAAPIKLVTATLDKRIRLYVQQGKFRAGRVLFPRDASFLLDLEDELLTFPQSRFDDQVDSISQALADEDSGYDETLSWVR